MGHIRQVHVLKFVLAANVKVRGRQVQIAGHLGLVQVSILEMKDYTMGALTFTLQIGLLSPVITEHTGLITAGIFIQQMLII